MSRLYLPIGKKNAKPSLRRKKAAKFLKNFPVPADKRPPGRGIDALKRLQGIRVVL